MQNVNSLIMLLIHNIHFKTIFKKYIPPRIKETFAEFTVSHFTYKFHKYFSHFSLIDNNCSWFLIVFRKYLKIIIQHVWAFIFYLPPIPGFTNPCANLP